MDFLVVGLIIGGTIVVVSLLVHDLFPHLAPARRRRAPRTPAIEAELDAWTRLCRRCGAILAGAGALVLACTIGALALNVSDTAGSLIVAGSVLVAVVLGGVGILLSVRRYSDAVTIERSAAGETMTAAVTVPAGSRPDGFSLPGPDDGLFDDEIPLWSSGSAGSEHATVPETGAQVDPPDDYWPAWNERPAAEPGPSPVEVTAPDVTESIEAPADHPIELHSLPVSGQLGRSSDTFIERQDPTTRAHGGTPANDEIEHVSGPENPPVIGGTFASPLLADIGITEEPVDPSGGFRSTLLSDLFIDTRDEPTVEGSDDQLLGEAPAPLPSERRGRPGSHPDP